jgi:cytochrome o ubiquinol oxidase subunit 2
VQSSNALDPYKPLRSNVPAITIDVVALDWKWLFIYPEQGIASVNLVEFPENTPIHFYLTADAPMNSFWVPQLAGQIMVMPGMTTQLNLAATQLGDFNGFSGNISGEGFAGMAFTARAVSLEDFDQWVSSVQASSTTLSQGMYSTLLLPSEYNAVAYYAPVDPNLFYSIQTKYMESSSMDEPASTADEPTGSMQMTP